MQVAIDRAMRTGNTVISIRRLRDYVDLLRTKELVQSTWAAAGQRLITTAMQSLLGSGQDATLVAMISGLKMPAR